MPIELYAWNTPNGRKISVALEEMGPAVQRSSGPHISKNEQFARNFLKISPNNRIPAIIDPDGPDGKPINALRIRRDPVVLGEEGGEILSQCRPIRAGSLPSWSG